jgi:ribonuclease HII
MSDDKKAKISKCLEITYNDMTTTINNNLYEIGIDEVGRGPMFGRVYCAAVILPKEGNFKYDLMKDSKKFNSKKKIQEVAQYIKENCIAWSIEYQDERTIDNINILQSTYQAMHNSITNILKQDTLKNYYLLLDGNSFKPYMRINKNTETIEQLPHICIEGGDNKYCSIAAASILAKVERDSYIAQLCQEYPKLSTYYVLEKNMGYGTKAHIDGIKEYGISPWHRKTYGLCRNANMNNAEFYKAE